MMRYPLCVGSWGRGLVNLFQYLAKEALVVVIVYMFYKHHLLPKRPEIIPTGDWLSTLLILYIVYYLKDFIIRTDMGEELMRAQDLITEQN